MRRFAILGSVRRAFSRDAIVENVLWLLLGLAFSAVSSSVLNVLSILTVPQTMGFGIGGFALVAAVTLVLRQRRAGSPTLARGAVERPTDTLETFRLSGPSSPHMHVVSFETAFLSERHIATRWKPRALRFVLPVKLEVKEDDLPITVDLPVTPPDTHGQLIVKRFTETGFTAEEIDTLGVQVQVEVYFDESGAAGSVPSYKVRVVNELIERGVSLRNSIHERSGHIQTTFVAEQTEGWARECWDRLGETVPGLRGLWHMQTHAGSTPADIIGYIDMRLSELRRILDKLT